MKQTLPGFIIAIMLTTVVAKPNAGTAVVGVLSGGAAVGGTVAFARAVNIGPPPIEDATDIQVAPLEPSAAAQPGYFRNLVNNAVDELHADGTASNTPAKASSVAGEDLNTEADALSTNQSSLTSDLAENTGSTTAEGSSTIALDAAGDGSTATDGLTTVFEDGIGDV
jgi:hypothetical protein